MPWPLPTRTGHGGRWDWEGRPGARRPRGSTQTVPPGRSRGPTQGCGTVVEAKQMGRVVRKSASLVTARVVGGTEGGCSGQGRWAGVGQGWSEAPLGTLVCLPPSVLPQPLAGRVSAHRTPRRWASGWGAACTERWPHVLSQNALGWSVSEGIPRPRRPRAPCRRGQPRLSVPSPPSTLRLLPPPQPKRVRGSTSPSGTEVCLCVKAGGWGAGMEGCRGLGPSRERPGRGRQPLTEGQPRPSQRCGCWGRSCIV